MASHKDMAWDVSGWHHGAWHGLSLHGLAQTNMRGATYHCIAQRLLVPRSHGNPASACSQGATPLRLAARGQRPTATPPAAAAGRLGHAACSCICRDAFGCTCMCMCKRMTACPCVSTSTCTQEQETEIESMYVCKYPGACARARD